MTVLDPNRQDDLAAAEAVYWSAVRFTVGRVFGADPAVADEYRRDLSEAPPLERALALHDHPLDVAAALGKPVTIERTKAYDQAFPAYRLGEPVPVDELPARVERTGEILSSARRDDSAPMVTVSTLNRFMGELGYQRLAVFAGVAAYVLERKAWKRPLPRRIDMETLPGLTADREEVYGLDRALNVLNGLQEYARRRKPSSSIVFRIEKMKARLQRQS
ncbi:hypothetical protein ACE10Z_09760 [Bradyrhizobium sp. Pha-3]|uniref:hypothetical protein n=1 Tax=Bradyrhizobium sp. Pha-3 TaxID=208375 RepID=UPI0035D46060